MVNEIIQKVWLNKHNKQKAVTIPYDCGIEAGEWVEITKLAEEEDGED